MSTIVTAIRLPSALRSRIPVLFSGLLILLAISSCGAMSSSESLDMESSAPASEEVARTMPTPVIQRPSQAQAAAPRAESSTNTESTAQKVAVAAPLASTVFASGAKIIRNGSLSLIVESPSDALQEIQQVIADIPGAFIANAELRKAGDAQPTSLTLRVPAEAFDRALSALRALAHEVLVEQITASDVTEEYSDVDARIRNLQVAEAQLLSLLEKAGTVEDLLKVQNRLSEVREEIEKLQGRLNVLENRIALATIHVQLHAPLDVSVEVEAESPPTAHAVTRFDLTYRNDGSVVARDVELNLHVPERFSVFDVSQGGRFDPTARVIRWSLSDVAPDTGGRVYAQLRVVSAENDVLLSAEIHTASVDANTMNDTANITLSFAPDLALDVEAPASGAQGSGIPVWISYENVGTADASNVTILATLPPGLTFVRADFGGSYDSEASTVVWKLGRVQAKTSGQVTMRLQVDAVEGALQIPIAISSDDSDALDFNNQADVFVTALREDVSERSVWQPGQTLESSFAALVFVAQRAVEVLIWVLVFGIPLGIIALLGFGLWSGIRRLGRSRDS